MGGLPAALPGGTDTRPDDVGVMHRGFASSEEGVSGVRFMGLMGGLESQSVEGGLPRPRAECAWWDSEQSLSSCVVLTVVRLCCWGWGGGAAC